MSFRTSRTVATVAFAILTLATAAFAQYPQVYGDPVFAHPAPHVELAPSVGGAQLVQWNGSFTDLTGHLITFTQVGTNPATTNKTTTIPVWVIPIKFVYDSGGGEETFDPQHKLSNGQTVTQNTLKSPLFNAGIDFKEGPTELGNTQYIDAFQRGTWWGKNVKKNTNYHVLMKPVLKPEQTINCTDFSCQVANVTIRGKSVVAGLADINYYDSLVQGFMSRLGATPNVLPFFIFYDVYLTSGGGCCIGGYHNTNGAQPTGQTYLNAAYVDEVGQFSQDVSAMSHELGEWMDDPFVDNFVNCQDNGIMEVGDPLERDANFGGFPYKLNGFTYNLQSLVFIGYFGAPTKDSANKWLSFQNDEKRVCAGQ